MNKNVKLSIRTRGKLQSCDVVVVVSFRSCISVTLSSGVHSPDAINKILTEQDADSPCPDERLQSWDRGSLRPGFFVASYSPIKLRSEFRGEETQR